MSLNEFFKQLRHAIQNGLEFEINIDEDIRTTSNGACPIRAVHESQVGILDRYENYNFDFLGQELGLPEKDWLSIVAASDAIEYTDGSSYSRKLRRRLLQAIGLM